jgi:hypothetical protein
VLAEQGPSLLDILWAAKDVHIVQVGKDAGSRAGSGYQDKDGVESDAKTERPQRTALLAP